MDISFLCVFGAYSIPASLCVSCVRPPACLCMESSRDESACGEGEGRTSDEVESNSYIMECRIGEKYGIFTRFSFLL